MIPILTMPVTPPAAAALYCALPLVTTCIDAPAAWTYQALLDYGDRAREILIADAAEARILAGRWRVVRLDRSGPLRFELEVGPLPGLTLILEARELGARRTLLECEGTYLATHAPLAHGQRTRQLAEGLRDGLLLSLEQALAPEGLLRGERRMARRYALALPARLRLGAAPWPGALRDVSATGTGILIPAPALEARSIAALIRAHYLGTLELVCSDGRLTASVRVRRAEAAASGVSVGLEASGTEDRGRLLRRLAGRGLWAG